MPGGHGDDEDDTAPAAVTGAAAGPGRRFMPIEPPRDLQAALAPIDADKHGQKIFENLGVQDITPELVTRVCDLLLLRSYFLTNDDRPLLFLQKQNLALAVYLFGSVLSLPD
jgi:hypothetical protein